MRKPGGAWTELVRHQRKHVRIDRPAAQQQALAGQALVHGAGLARHRHAGQVPVRDDDLHACQLQRIEGVPRQGVDGGQRRALALLRGPHPIAQVAEAVHGIELVQPRAAGQRRAVIQEDAEFVGAAVRAGGIAEREPGQGLVRGVIGMRPVHPLADAGHRLAHGGGERRCVGGNEGA